MKGAESSKRGPSATIALVGLAYTVALFVGSIPEWMRWNEDVDQTVRSVRTKFYKVRAKPGLGVFHGNGLQLWNANELCLVVAGKSGGASQAWERVYESYPDCDYPNFRWSVDHFNLVLAGQVGVGRLEAIARWNQTQRRRTVTGLRNRKQLDGVLQYFCDESELDEVHMVVKATARKYETGKTRARVDVIHSRDCVRERKTASNRIAVSLDSAQRLVLR